MCGERHWFSTDPLGVYSYCNLSSSPHSCHIDEYGRWWELTVSKEMPVEEQILAKKKRYASR